MVIAFLFAVFTLYGCGATAVLYGLMLLIFGIAMEIPLFVLLTRRVGEQSRPHTGTTVTSSSNMPHWL